jgi:hypothetical protein
MDIDAPIKSLRRNDARHFLPFFEYRSSNSIRFYQYGFNASSGCIVIALHPLASNVQESQEMLTACYLFAIH